MDVCEENDPLSENKFEDLWLYLPDQVLLHIFQFFSGQELSRVKQVCSTWHRVGCDELLWRDLLHKDYKIDKSIGLPPGNILTIRIHFFF